MQLLKLTCHCLRWLRCVLSRVVVFIVGKNSGATSTALPRCFRRFTHWHIGHVLCQRSCRLTVAAPQKKAMMRPQPRVGNDFHPKKLNSTHLRHKSKWWLPCLGDHGTCRLQDLLCQFGDPSTLAFKDHLQVQTLMSFEPRVFVVFFSSLARWTTLFTNINMTFKNLWLPIDLFAVFKRLEMQLWRSKGAIQTIMRHQLDGLVMVGNLANQAGEVKHQAASSFEWRNYPCAGGHRILSRGQPFQFSFLFALVGIYEPEVKACAAERLPTKVIGVPVPTLGFWAIARVDTWWANHMLRTWRTSLLSQVFVYLQCIHQSWIPVLLLLP